MSSLDPESDSQSGSEHVLQDPDSQNFPGSRFEYNPPGLRFFNCATVQESAELFQCSFAPTSKDLNLVDFFSIFRSSLVLNRVVRLKPRVLFSFQCEGYFS